MFKELPIAFDSPYFNWTYKPILTKNELIFAYFAHFAYPYISLRLTLGERAQGDCYCWTVSKNN